MVIPLMSGGVARAWTVTVVSPLELIRTKMQSQKMPFSKLKDALKNTVKSEGVVGLWKGWAPTMLRDVPFSAIFWSAYEGELDTLKYCMLSYMVCLHVVGFIGGKRL